MRAMILAAGEGRRMRPLTNTTPKPLLEVGGKPLLEHHILNLKAAGFTRLVVNAAYLGEQIREFCGDGSRWGVSIQLSVEPRPLETAGGIINALPLLAETLGADAADSEAQHGSRVTQPFLVVNGDVYCPYPFERLAAVTPNDRGAHLVLVDNPAHNPAGDFQLANGRIEHPENHPAEARLAATRRGGEAKTPKLAFTFSGIGVYSPDMFAGLDAGKRPLKPLLDEAIQRRQITGEHWQGPWTDVGTPERLAELNGFLNR